MKYDELLQKYKTLEEENRVLKDEIARLRMLLSEEASLSVQDSDFSVKFQDTHAESEKVSEKAEPIAHTMTEAVEEDHSQYQITSYPVASSYPVVSKNSSNDEKISLFLDLFRGRSDVCAKRWKNKPGYSPYCYNDFKAGVCQKPRIKCAKCDNSAFAPLNHEEIRKHLLGKHVLGLYPLTPKDTCYLLAMDFDESAWKDDISVVKRLCYENRIPVYAERSRSGNGCHLWFFFEEEIKSWDDDTDVESVIFDETDYFTHVMNDMRHAGKNILISSPYVQKRKVDMIKNMLIEKFNAGIHVTLCIRALEEYSDKQKMYGGQLVDELVKHGVNVIQMRQNRYKYMIIDSRIVWYGGIDILGGSYGEASMIRIQNEELANELLGTISPLTQKPS